MELATPITIYWDLPAGATDFHRLLRVCEEIISCRPLMLHLTDPGPVIGEGIITLLNRLKGVPIAVSLTIPVSALGSAAADIPRDADLKEILLALEHTGDISASLLQERRDGTLPDDARRIIGLSFKVTRENWRELSDLVRFCRETGIPRLVLPMQRLYDGAPPFFLTGKEQRELSEALSSAGGVQGLNLTIHDPFLWRAVNPRVPFPQGGCQAANTMLAIAPDGRVYPCPTLPVSLGDTGMEPLGQIIASSRKKELRHRLLETPDGCRGCGDLAVCLGGCRGRAFASHGSVEKPDPACR